MGKFKALVIKEDGLMLPKGHISAVLSPRQEPSEYERSPQSPWQIVLLDKDPRPRLEQKNDLLGRSRFTKEKKHLFLDGDIKTKKRKDIKKEKSGKRHPHPPLQTGSLIWDYGVGRTYSTPQAAFDACLAYWGAGEIDSNQIIRGYGNMDINEPSDVVVRVHSLLVNNLEDKWLIFDADGSSVVRWISGPCGLMGAVGGVEQPVNGVKIEGIEINVNWSDGIAIACQDPTGSISAVDAWRIDKCKLQHTKVEDPYLSLGVMLLGCLRPSISKSRIIDFNDGFPTCLGLPLTDSSTLMTLKSSIVDVGESAIFLGSNPGSFQLVVAVNSLLKGKYGVRLYNGSALNYRQNCVVQATDYIKFAPSSGLYLLIDGESDGNLYQYGTNFGLFKEGEINLAQQRSIYICDAHSLDNIDPMIGPDYVPDDESPVWKAGVAFCYDDIEDRIISRNVVDIGPFQYTLANPYDPGACGYCSIQDVHDATGVSFEDLGCADLPTLDAMLCNWIHDVSDIIDEYCETSWVIGSHPGGVKRVAISMMADLVAIAVQRRKSPFVTLSDFQVKLVQDDLLNEESKKTLNLYKRPEATLGKQYLGFGSGSIDPLEDDDA